MGTAESSASYSGLVLRKNIIKFHACLNSALDGAKRTSKPMKLEQSE
jgi:hypothetical protein